VLATKEENEILLFLKSSPQDYFSAKEIGRRVGGKKKHRDAPLWAKPILIEMARRDLVETDEMGHYRVTRERPKPKIRKYISPQIRKILEQSGRQFGHDVVLDLTDDFENL
jgi:hypothetical protein